MKLFLLSLFLVASTLPAVLSKVQSYWFKGEFRCHHNQASNVLIRLIEEDSYDPDDLMDEGRTNRMGMIELKGTASELTKIEPVVKAYHDCEDFDKKGKQKKCQRVYRYVLDRRHINATTITDIGRIQLENMVPGEKRECVEGKKSKKRTSRRPGYNHHRRF